MFIYQIFGVVYCSDWQLKMIERFRMSWNVRPNVVMKVMECSQDCVAIDNDYVKVNDCGYSVYNGIYTIEGHFGDLKENDKFRRFNYRSTKKVHKEFMMYSFGRNMNKYHKFTHGQISEFVGNATQQAA